MRWRIKARNGDGQCEAIELLRIKGTMGTSSALPLKQYLPREIWKVATTLSDDAQNAAMRKARELAFDLSKGRIPLDETLLNISHNRDILLDAADKNKLVQ